MLQKTKKAWFSMALQDPAFLYGTFAWYSIGLRAMQKRGDNAETFLYHGKAIAMVKERLNQSQPQFIEGTVGAVAAFVFYEVRFSLVS
jgi:hypothetical protein